ncbi:hypothetical protein SISNIDRAFT_492044 [Sistotremastrum niveocremeum HHB9708]|uniref:Uncharacterized protein n=1 Tax=Sistotremastrum niveocremeum HHB9708 TaxID=1314777 RepID=A0A164M485_9AGAM|nr:hypothetical protein SISNIDRAFT_492044 [Sistotremastrum niveocremeum HHB9708]
MPVPYELPGSNAPQPPPPQTLTMTARQPGDTDLAGHQTQANHMPSSFYMTPQTSDTPYANNSYTIPASNTFPGSHTPSASSDASDTSGFGMNSFSTPSPFLTDQHLDQDMQDSDAEPDEEPSQYRRNKRARTEGLDDYADIAKQINLNDEAAAVAQQLEMTEDDKTALENFAQLSLQVMQIHLYGQIIQLRRDSGKMISSITINTKDFMDKIRGPCIAAITSPDLPIYVDGLSGQMAAYFGKRLKSLGVPPEALHDQVTWKNITSLIGTELTTQRANLKKAIERAIADKSDILVLTQDALRGPLAPTAEHFVRFALLREIFQQWAITTPAVKAQLRARFKVQGRWLFVDHRLREIRQAHPTKVAQISYFNEVLNRDTEQYPVINQKQYAAMQKEARGQIPDWQKDMEAGVLKFKSV